MPPELLYARIQIKPELEGTRQLGKWFRLNRDFAVNGGNFLAARGFQIELELNVGPDDQFSFIVWNIDENCSMDISRKCIRESDVLVDADQSNDAPPIHRS
jgi:hypothetical protein